MAARPLPMPSALATDPAALLWRTLLTGLLLVACITDVRARRIPNALVLVTLALGVGHALLAWGGAVDGAGFTATPWAALLGTVVGLLVGLPFWAAGIMGGGDVKLFAAAAAWLGPTLVPEAATATAIAGGGLALLWMARRVASRAAALVPSLSGVWVAIERHPVTVPYGLAIAGGIAGPLWLAG